MKTVHPQYIVDENKKEKAVVLSINEWEVILDELEELDDIRAYDSVKRKNDEVIPFEEAVKEIEGDYGD